MGQSINFTKAALDKAACPAEESRTYLYDARTPRLALLVTAKGAKSFYVVRRVAGRPQRIRLGGYPDMTIDQARRRTAEVQGDIARGIDPQAERRKARASMIMADLLEHYLNSHAKHHKKSWRQDRAMFYRYFGSPPAERVKGDDSPPFPSWRTRQVNTIGGGDVQALHSKVGSNHGHYAANRLLSLLSKMFNNARLPNPAKGVKRFREVERERFLHPDELPRFFQALKEEPNLTIRDFLLTLILAGARRGNTQAMRWDQVNLDRATWTISDTKGGTPQTVHLPPSLVRILVGRKALGDASPWVFPGPGKTGHLMEPKAAWTAILERAGIKDLRVHDLRRTLGSWQAAGGASLPIIGKSLGHKSERTTRIYARLTLDPIKQSVNAATGAMTALMPTGLLPDETKKQGQE